MIKALNFDKQYMKSEDFALTLWRFFQMNDGVIYGCDLSFSNNNVSISNGYFIASGYILKVEDNQVVPISSTGTLVYEIDLSKENTELEFKQGSFKIINTAPQQENLFEGGNIYQLPIASIQIENNNIISMNKLWNILNGEALTTAGGTVTGNLIITGNLNANSINNGQPIPRFYNGTSDPDNNIGLDGDIYLKYKV